MKNRLAFGFLIVAIILLVFSFCSFGREPVLASEKSSDLKLEEVLKKQEDIINRLEDIRKQLDIIRVRVSRK